ncbi:GBS Bsp-like repeat-containing protein [Streptococcus macacae]|uniref:Lysozyme n=1 Tax=Streptococcus macacae NCTC 11558 TaxID=764298 RepID=G5JZ01_9STRE|nr:GBS Bsp-like repeat-containing protein [Streptococcus macacae]EHJ52102.1 GBS Bsp-like repeat protein [Streptococcus macacae NCTC 11558]SUN78257.1 autolysin AtlA [Streptococcus macacae NCTC 11558]
MEKRFIKTYLVVPLALTMFAAAKVSADESQAADNQTSAAKTVVSTSSQSSVSRQTAAAETSSDQMNSASNTGNTGQEANAEKSENTTTEASTENPRQQGDTSVREETTEPSSQEVSKASSSTDSQTLTNTANTTSRSADEKISDEKASQPKTQSSQAKPERLKRSSLTAVSQVNQPASKIQQSSKKEDRAKEVTKAIVEEKGIKLQYNDSIAPNTKIQFAVWSDSNGQDDLRWYTANNMGAAYVEFKNHRSYGSYNIHTYANKNGKMIGLNAAKITIPLPQVKTSITKTSARNFDIVVSNVPNTITKVSVPVWSAIKGQDDLKWYQASKTAPGTYKVTVNTKDHGNDLGHYQAHVYGYSTVTDSQIGLAATSGFDNNNNVKLTNASVSIANYDQNKTTFDVNVKGSENTKTLKAVRVAVWSQENGQDDLKWYTPQVKNNQATAKVDIANHANVSGDYNVHVYTDYTDGTTSGTVLGTYKIIKSPVSAKLTSNGIALKFEANTIKDKSKVSFAVWSDVKGQDDLRWYSANDKGEALAAFTNHKGYGNYNIHTYVNQNGKMIGLDAKTLMINPPNISTHITKAGDNQYTVTLKNVPDYISSVQVPVWTEQKGQDDIKWYQAQKTADKTYEAKILLKNHSFEKGHYNVHVYGHSQLESNNQIGLGTSGFDVSSVKIEDAQVSVTNHNAKNGSLDVVVSETNHSKKLKTVRVAVWSTANQSNLYWYTSSDVKNDRINIAVNESNHQYIKGNYNVHVYVTYQDGQEKGFNKGSYRLEADRPAVQLPSYFIDISSHNGSISVDEFRRLKQAGIEGVVVKLTEGTTYTNPLARSQITNAKAAGIKVSAYHYSHYTSAAAAQAEARYFANAAQAHGLGAATVMVNDMEESSMLANVNNNVQAWQDEMKRLGYGNLVHYTMASWLDIRGGQVNTSRFGINNFWIAHYAKGYNYMTQAEAKSNGLYSNAAAWQYTSVSPKLGRSLDENIDYTGRFTR